MCVAPFGVKALEVAAAGVAAGAGLLMGLECACKSTGCAKRTGS
jgi:hypothetical protein